LELLEGFVSIGVILEADESERLVDVGL